MSNEYAQHDAEAKQAILGNSEKYGCHLALLEADNYLPAFVYSIGLFQKFGHPEIICFGLKTDVMAAVINAVRSQIEKGEQFEEGKLYEGFLQDYAIRFVEVAKGYYPNYLGYGGWFYNMSFDFPTLQLVWPDKEHRFPWEIEFNEDWKFKQPLLDRNTEFKFYEERNLGVYTTKQVFEGEPILYAYHNEDGDWQFHTSDEPNLEDAIFVCLEEITKLAPSVNEIFHLQYGWKAWRNSIKEEWKYEEDRESQS